MKRTTIKHMKATGWYDFVQWAIWAGYRPEQISNNHLELWRAHLSVLALCSNIEKDLFKSVSDLDKNIMMNGLRKQLSKESL
jgi:hypothetical protein